jgi:uncharacterized protein YoxC
MDFWLSFLPIIIYALIIIILVVGIVLGIKSIRTVKKVEKVVDNVNDKVESLNAAFNVIDFTTDKIATFTDKFVDGVTGVFGRLFTSKKKDAKDDAKEDLDE